MLGSLDIICMRLRITDICHLMFNVFGSDEESMEEPSAEDVLNTVTVQLARVIPSLRYLAVGVGDKRYDMYSRSWQFVGQVSWWRVLRGPDNVQHEYMEPNLGRAIIEHIKSPEFEKTLHFDGEWGVCSHS